MAIISIENLSKRYWIQRSGLEDSFKEALSNKLKRLFFHPFQKNRPPASLEREEFWALSQVSFCIEEGDRIAFLGRNGAGKSTLLKILSRITEPTLGKVSIKGRVASLLEVGTGFHPDLTGRENIFLNGAIMGMSWKEIKNKFDEIVAFADIEPFLDTPLKRYSSGMFMRLGFAVAAHLESEILIVDEVLAVGDAQFQEKCLKKMDEIGKQSRTILFVSHNVNSVLALCNKGVFLEKGTVKALEPIEQCVSRYLLACPTSSMQWAGEAGNEDLSIKKVALRPSQSNSGFFTQNEKTHLDIAFEVHTPHPDLVIGFSILNGRNMPIATTRLCDHPSYSHIGALSGSHRASCELDLALFHPGEYRIHVEASLLNQKKIIDGEVVLKFAVFSQHSPKKTEQGMEKGGICLGNRWQVEVYTI